MNRNFLTVNVKLQKKHTIKYKIVNQEFLRLVVFPEEILLQKTEADHEDLPKRTIKKRKLYLNKQWRILKQKLKKRKVLNAIRTAAESYKDFPLNQVEYVQLLWDALDEIEEEVRHITPIINSSTHNNTMRCLYTILMENSENLIKLIEYEVEPISIFHFEQVCFKLMDNLLTCNRVLLACCYAQNSYQKVNKALENLIVLVEHFEIIVEFVSTAILQSRGRVQNYVPSGRIIRHLNCSMCDTVVSLAGCYCTNWALDSLSSKRAKLFTNPLEDGAVTSSARCIESWDMAVYYLRNLPPPEMYRPPMQFTTKHRTAFVEAPLVIRNMDEKREQKTRKRKARDTIDQVWYLDALSVAPQEPDCKRKAGNDVWLAKELKRVLDEMAAHKTKQSRKRKAEKDLDDIWILDNVDNIIQDNSDIPFEELLEQLDAVSDQSKPEDQRE